MLLYVPILITIYMCAFGLPFATKRMKVALVFLAAALVLFVAAIPLGRAEQGRENEVVFLVVLAFSTVPFAAGAAARVISLALFADKKKEWLYVLGTGLVTSIVFIVLGWFLQGALL